MSDAETPAKDSGATKKDTDRLHRWLTLGANVGVLIGLVLVIVQINQNTQMARTAYKNEGNVVANQAWVTLMGDRAGDVIEKSSECPDELTYSDFMALDAFLFTSINIIYRDFQLTQEGLFSESDWKQSVDTYVHWYLANPFGRAWWDEEAKGFFPDEFAAYVGNRLGTVSGKDSRTYWLAIRRRVTGREPAGRPTVCNGRELQAPTVDGAAARPD
jgi:hypothetical protein